MVIADALWKWQAQKFDKEKKISFAITLLLILLLYLALDFTQIPTHRRRREADVDREILINTYHPPTRIEIAPVQPVPPKHVEQTRVSQRASSSAKNDPVDQIAELENFSKQFDFNFSDIKKDRSQASVPRDVQVATIDNSQLPIPASNQGSDYGQSSIIKRFTRTTSLNTNVSTMKNTSQVKIEKQSDYSSDVYNTSMIDDKALRKNTTITQISMIKVPDDLKSKMPKIFVNIQQWMKDNIVPLPNAIQKFMSYRPPYLTSKVEFQIDDRFFEIFLLCNESTYEIKICLIEGNQTTLLIDEGFKHESHFLRTGRVNRTRKNEILSFGTKQEAASKNETRQFYQIFLSWWKTTGMDKL